ncbi:MAG TPA: hypothetical protein PLK61_12375 [Nitrosomonas sp.]|nr:hypothetical protein [Nitrosomonas sp.]
MINTFFSLGYPAEKIRLIVNRYDKKDEITLADVANTLKLEVFKAIPNDYNVVAESVNQGIPVTKLAKRSAVAKSLHEFVQEMAQSSTSNKLLKKLFAFG